MNVWEYGLFRIVLLLINIIFPTYAGRSVSFGVVVPSKIRAHSELKSIVRWYRIVSGCIGGLLLIAELAFLQFKIVSSLTALIYFTPFSQTIQFFIYVIAYRKMNRLKKEQGWQMEKQKSIVVDLSVKNRVSLSRWFNLFPIFFIAVNIIVIAYFYNKIPDQFPIHYTNGKVDRFAEKSIPIVFLMNLIQIGFLAIMIGVQEGIIRSKRQIYLSTSHDVHRMRRRHLFVVHGITGIGLLFFSIIQLAILQFLSSNIGWLIEVANILILAVAFIFGRSSNKASNYEEGREWKIGLFYFNPRDPAIIVERLNGAGYTVNFGRVGGWGVIVAPVLFVVIMIWYSYLL